MIDGEQRQRALQADESFIVQAPAGSGKTELLIQRFLVLLSRVENPEEIVAITFTRKAAAEMQGRIIDAIERAREAVPPETEVARQTDELARLVLEQDQKRDWHLEENPGRLRIQTIDSLCVRLTRQMPILAHLGARPETVEDASMMYRDAANRVLEELEGQDVWSDDIALLFSHLDNDIPKIRDLLSNMLARRDQWLRHVAIEIDRNEQEEALSAVVKGTLSRIRQCFPVEHVSELMTCFRYAAKNLNGESREHPELPAAGMDSLADWQLLAEICLTKKNEWRKSVDVRQGFPASGEGKAMKDRFRSLLSRLSADEGLLDLLVDIRYLPPVHYSDEEWQIVSALGRLLVLADAGLRVLFGERNQIDFNGISMAAVSALGSAEAPTNLALHLDYRIRHLLVDEFQDVSTTQYTLLKLITAGWSAGDGHSLFLVGDPMQSIYRFREAEVRLFLKVWADGRLGQVPLTTLNLSVNFRSRAGIVDWVNRTFQQLMPDEPDLALGVVGYVPAVAYTSDPVSGSVHLHPFPGKDGQQEAKQVVTLVRSAQRENPAGSIAILVRGRAHLTSIVPQLRQAGLRFRAVEIEPLGERPAIQDLLALTLALNRFADRIAWLAILRAPWCGLCLQDLYHLAGESGNLTIWQCMHDPERLRRLSRDGQQRLLKCRAILELHFSGQARRSLRRSVESVWMSLGGPATLEDTTDLENSQTFFELLEEFDQGSSLGRETQFFNRITKLFAAPAVEADESLQIMTIHKAKGLEFDTVIVPGLEKGSRHDEPPLLRWEELPDGDSLSLLLAPIQKAGEDPSPIHEYLKRLEAQKQHYEEQRLLYVAVTRARKQLHLLASVSLKETEEALTLNTPKKGSLLHHLWPQVKGDIDNILHDGRLPSREPETPLHQAGELRRLSADWQLPAPPDAIVQPDSRDELAGEEGLPEFEWAGETIKHIGTVTHRAIQEIAEQGIAGWDEKRLQSNQQRYARALLRLGVPSSDLDWAGKSVMQALINLIGDVRGRWILDPKHYSTALNEYSISGLYRGRVVNAVIDRTFVDSDNVRWIIDYKTSRHEGPDQDAFLDQERERYQQQMEKYGELMRHLDNRIIKLGLYFPLLRGWREIPFQTGPDTGI